MVDKKDACKVNIAILGGQTDVVQALWKVKNERNTEEYLKFIHKIRIYDVNDQDGLYLHIKKEFPELFYILAKAPDGMDKREGVYRGMYLGGDESLTSGEWIESNVLDNHGTLAELYPVKTFTAPNPHGVMKEGDTPSWFYFLDNGLQNADHPEWGGWGGRFLPEEGNFYRDAEDFGLDGIHARATVYRWRPFFQNDFAARLDWCVSEYAEANHPPIALLDGYGAREEIIITSEAGERVVLSAASSFDPDSDELDFFWWTYPEAGTNEVCPELENYLSSEVSFITPFGEEGNNIHLICEVSDRGEPSLTSFRRIIVNME